jgi:hypothetical protein
MFTLGVQFTGVCKKFKNNSKVPDLGVILFEGCSIGVQFGFGGTQVLKVFFSVKIVEKQETFWKHKFFVFYSLIYKFIKMVTRTCIKLSISFIRGVTFKNEVI